MALIIPGLSTYFTSKGSCRDSMDVSFGPHSDLRWPADKQFSNVSLSCQSSDPGRRRTVLLCWAGEIEKWGVQQPAPHPTALTGNFRVFLINRNYSPFLGEKEWDFSTIQIQCVMSKNPAPPRISNWKPQWLPSSNKKEWAPCSLIQYI